MRTERAGGGLPRWGVNRGYWVRVGDAPFLDRRVLLICPWLAVLWTEIHGPDDGRDPHDHSRSFVSIIISGGYDENVYADPADLGRVRARSHRRWSAHLMPSRCAHSITGVRGRLRTLALAGRSRGTWAFWTADGKVDWREYED
jgi:hypothetical protein